MTLIYELDLDILPLDRQNSSPYICPFGRESETHRHTDDVKTITPDTSQKWSVIKHESQKGAFYTFVEVLQIMEVINEFI